MEDMRAKEGGDLCMLVLKLDENSNRLTMRIVSRFLAALRGSASTAEDR